MLAVMSGILCIFTAQAEYAVGALVELSDLRGEQTVRSPELARRLDVSPSSMEQVMVRLRRHGIVRSVRGATGGYALARSAAEITLEDVLRVFVPARHESRPAPPPAPTRVVVREAIEGVERQILTRAAQVRISELARSARERNDVMAIMPGL